MSRPPKPQPTSAKRTRGRSAGAAAPSAWPCWGCCGCACCCWPLALKKEGYKLALRTAAQRGGCSAELRPQRPGRQSAQGEHATHQSTDAGFSGTSKVWSLSGLLCARARYIFLRGSLLCARRRAERANRVSNLPPPPTATTCLHAEGLLSCSRTALHAAPGAHHAVSQGRRHRVLRGWELRVAWTHGADLLASLRRTAVLVRRRR